MKSIDAPAKINLALVVGPVRPDGKHEVATVLQRVDLADRISLEPAGRLDVRGFEGDTLVQRALEGVANLAGVSPHWSVHIEKRIPVAAGLGGGSSDAATAIRLANETLERPLGRTALHKLAHLLGTDVPFFLKDGPQLGKRDGAALSRISLPMDYSVLLVHPAGARKASTKAVYDAFSNAEGFEERKAALLAAVEAKDIAALPPNDLASSPLAQELRAAGAFRADVSGAGPTVYGLFADAEQAAAARELFAGTCTTWLTAPAW